MRSEAEDLQSPSLGPGAVEFFYVHGRIPSNGSDISLHRVLDEIDYATSRTRTVDFLQTVFSVPRSVVIIVGSSLTDPPLIDGLALTRTASNTRVALFALEPTGLYAEELCDEIIVRLQNRAKILGFELLVPDFLFQIPQFLTELSQAILDPAGPSAYLTSESRYGARLQEWWRGFNEHWTPETLHAAVRTAYSSVLPYLTSSDGEQLRLDLRVREEPERRQLTMVASTIGPLTDSRLLKREQLRLGSTHATLSAFVQGRPRYFGLEDFDWPEGFHGRWKSFLVVPLQAQIGEILTPVGAATLSSNLVPSHSAIGRLSREDRNRTLALIRAMLELPVGAD